jgi:uncharacterized protein YndB with AHSA1/START domain
VTNDARRPVTDRAVFISRSFNGPRELIWRFWTEPDLLASWFGPEGVTVPPESVLVEPRVGGRWELAMQNDLTGEFNSIRGRITVFLDPEYLEITMDADTSAGSLEDVVLRLEFHDHGSRTRVTLHQGPFADDIRDITLAGWTRSFVVLDSCVKGIAT